MQWMELTSCMPERIGLISQEVLRIFASVYTVPEGVIGFL